MKYMIKVSEEINGYNVKYEQIGDNIILDLSNVVKLDRTGIIKLKGFLEAVIK